MNKILDFFFLMRPTLMIPVWTISLLGARSALWRERGINPVTIDRLPWLTFTASDLNIVAMLLLSGLLVGAAYVLNQIYDVDTDQANRKLFLISEGHVSKQQAWYLYFIATAIAILGAFIVNWQLGVLFVVGAWFGVQYSHPKFNLRQNTYKSFRNNAVGIGTLAFLFGWVMYLNFDIEGIIKSIPYFLAVGAVYLNTTLPDIPGDVASGKKTYGSEWGIQKSQNVAIYMLVAGLILSVMIADYAFTLTALFSLPFFAVARVKGSVASSTLASKVAILSLSVFALLFFPIYALFLLFVIFLSRIYYSRRFGMNYPSFAEKS